MNESKKTIQTFPENKPEHIRENRSQEWKHQIMPKGISYDCFPYGLVFRFRKNIYSIFEKSFDGHGDPWMHLIIGPEKALLIDTGFGIGDLKTLVHKLAGEKPVIVVNTHSHLDHCYGNCQFEQVYCHSHSVSRLKLHNASMWDTLMDENGHGIFRDFTRNDIVSFQPYTITPVENHHVFDLGDHHEVEAIFMPGHDSGHFCFLDHGNRILFTGDSILFVAGITPLNDEPVPFSQYCTVEAYHNELKKLADRMNEFDCLFMSHMILGEDKQLVKDMYEAADAIIHNPDCNEFIHHDHHSGKVNKVKVCGNAAIEYNTHTVYMENMMHAEVSSNG